MPQGLSVTDPDKQPAQQNNMARHLVLGAAGGSGILFAVLELLHGDPKEWASLLEHWGPWFLIALVGMYFAYDLAKSIGFKLLALGVKLVANVGEMASAMQRMSDKDDSNQQECRLMSQFAARTAEQSAAVLTKQGEKLDEILAAVQRQRGTAT